MNMTQEKMIAFENEALGYYDELYRVCLSRVDFDEETAKSCVQETYLAFEEALKNRGIEIRKCRSWLFAVLYNHINMYYKEKIRHNQYQMNLDGLYDAEENGVQLMDESIDLALELEKKERNRTILEKAKQLKERDRQLLIHVYFEGGKLTELAKAMGENVNTVNKQHERLKKKLAKIYEDEGFDLYGRGDHK